MPTYYIKTYGCQMNVADSARLAAVLEGAGYTEFKTDDAKIKKLAGVDLILVNTCVVRQSAEDRAAWFVASLKGLKEEHPNLKIGLCGCLVPEPERNLKQQFPHVDFFIEPNRPEKLRAALEEANLLPSPSGRGGRLEGQRVRAGETKFVTIMTGCDNFCSYCVVPYVRGRETSRPLDEVLAEIKGLIEQGVTDITLLGQNVNSYKYGFATLLKQIGSATSDIGLRTLDLKFMTSHPKDLSDELIETIAELPYVAKDFHLPLQSGDDEILKKMNRGYTVDYFIGRVNKIRSLMPQARISTDLMVGFPGETEEQFENSLRTFEKIGFTMTNMFAYSPRPRTAAAKMADQIPEEVKQARLKRLIEVNRENLNQRLNVAVN